MLKPVLEQYSQYCVQDSFSFAGMIRDLPSEFADSFMCSFDISSIFTNVLLDDIVNICADSIFGTGNMSTFSRETFVELMKFATRFVAFSFNNIMYKQVDSAAMGSPLGAMLANIFVCYCKQKFMSALTDKKPICYFRCVDDTYAIFENEEACQHFYVLLNSLHPYKFTTERETSGQIPFLDGVVERSGSGFLTHFLVLRDSDSEGVFMPYICFSESRFLRDEMDQRSYCEKHAKLQIQFPGNIINSSKRVAKWFAK